MNIDSVFIFTLFAKTLFIFANYSYYSYYSYSFRTSSQDKLNELPPLFVANIGEISGSCGTTQSVNVDFPNPGKYVTTKKPAGPAQSQFPIAVPSNCGAAKAPAGNNPPGGVFAPGASSAAPSASPSNAAPEQQLAVPTTAPVSSKPSLAAAQPPLAPAKPVPAAPVANPQGSCAAGQVPCSETGFYCIDGTTFGQCVWGCATPMTMADGTKCEANTVTWAMRLLM
ncbi:hypothetical protein P152DRAFT_504267 [Eremomyces bilateralis CBS 781.70]|uniref:Carbohydrate-binding module family 19 domain-containing protein n=1 Tax=Eremomyces bilateralis CBS 781.70 TaxID=1392243 RepID=A0A6G1G490_9PEZI|nr:uncharacterized protein P152DRAFT_504267 [Eremomyces bilateralis CBS 781.70]KAF1812726.1 hypothetical protein P152DRAFT_504267 [Eremomyces bilateralis CBS 781.70]